MSKPHAPAADTPATQILRQWGVAYSVHPYDYVDHGGTGESARQLGVDEHAVVKTLVMEDQDGVPLVVLMHGDCQVATKALAQQVGARKVRPCAPEVAEQHSGYLVGGTSPFGLRKPLRIVVEQSVLELPTIYINGGRRGLLVGLNPMVLVTRLQAAAVHCAQPRAVDGGVRKGKVSSR